MSTTERLYYQDSHLLEFEAAVTGVMEHDKGRAAVVLDRTAFYPTGGGQPHDTGTLDAARVVECVEQESGEVLHVVEGAPPATGTRVRGRVDWPRRLDHIQQHTGQHILSQAFVELFGAQTHAFRMLDQSSEIDVALAEPSDERIERAVARANEIVWNDLPVRIHQVTPEEAASLPLRKDSAREGELRIIEIEGFDFSPCGGTHAQRTGEVGIIAVRSWERAKGLARIEFLAGSRVHADYQRANRTARQIASMLSAARDDTPTLVSNLLNENKNLLRRLRPLEELSARVEAGEMLNATTARADGTRIVARTFEARDPEEVKRLAFALVANAGTVALLGTRLDDVARLVFARSTDAPGDMNALMREACTTLDGRGGGRSDMAQGGGRKVELLAEIIATAARRLDA